MDKILYLVVGFICVAGLAASSILVGGQVQLIYGNEVFVPIMSTTATLLAFSLPEGGAIAVRVGIWSGLIFLLQFIVLCSFRMAFRIWTIVLVGLTTMLEMFQIIFGWDFAINYYGFGVTMFCMSLSIFILTIACLAVFRNVNGSGEHADFRLNIFVLCGLSWGALPYLGELP